MFALILLRKHWTFQTFSPSGEWRPVTLLAAPSPSLHLHSKWNDTHSRRTNCRIVASTRSKNLLLNYDKLFTCVELNRRLQCHFDRMCSGRRNRVSHQHKFYISAADNMHSAQCTALKRNTHIKQETRAIVFNQTNLSDNISGPMRLLTL